MDDWLKRTLAATSRLTNAAILNGDDMETVSSRAHREKWQAEALLNMIFWWQPDHCRQSYYWEQARKTHDCTNNNSKA